MYRPHALAVALLLTLAGSAAYGLDACTAGDITAQDPMCPAGNTACTIARDFTIGNNCTLDFGARAVTIGGILDLNSNRVTLRAGTLTITPGGFLDGRGTQTANSSGATLAIDTSGTVNIQKSGSTNGRIDLSGNSGGGSLTISAGATVTVAGRINADQLTAAGDGGSIVIVTPGDISVPANATLSATGGSESGGGGGEIRLVASGDITLGTELDVSGSSGGTIEIKSLDAVTTQILRANATAVLTGDAHDGGTIEVEGRSVVLQGQVLARGNEGTQDTGGGAGGSVTVTSIDGVLTVSASIFAEGAGPDGPGGNISLSARRAFTQAAAATISARSNAGLGAGGGIDIDATDSVTLNGTVDASGGGAGGGISVASRGNITAAGSIDASGRGTSADGGQVSFEAGDEGSGSLSVSGTVDVTGGACAGIDCPDGGTTNLEGCTVNITSSALVSANAPRAGSNQLTAHQHLIVAGTVRALKSTVSGQDGVNRLVYPTNDSPAITPAKVQPAAPGMPLPLCADAAQSDCLAPCPSCGNGVLEFPEQCDQGVGPSGCCNSFCRIEECDDGKLCTVDTCQAMVGCQHTAVVGACQEPATPTPTSTSTRAPTPTRTPTKDLNAPTATPVVEMSPTPSPTLAVASATPTTSLPTPTPSLSPTQAAATATPSVAAPASHTPTHTPTTLAPSATPSATVAASASATSTVPPTATVSASATRSATHTPTPSATNTATPTDTATPTETATPTHTHEPTATVPASSCAGDCSSDGEVTVNEIVSIVNIALGNAPISSCSNGDTNQDGEVTINEIIAAVNKALAGC